MDRFLDEELLQYAEDGNLNHVQSLLKDGADINARNIFQLTPLMLAVREGHEPMVDWLLRHGADIHAQDRNGFTALDIAVMNHRTVLVNKLRSFSAIGK